MYGMSPPRTLVGPQVNQLPGLTIHDHIPVCGRNGRMLGTQSQDNPQYLNMSPWSSVPCLQLPASSPFSFLLQLKHSGSEWVALGAPFIVIKTI